MSSQIWYKKGAATMIEYNSKDGLDFFVLQKAV